MPKISVIVPVYKVEPYINRCVDSILKQTFHDFELILVDDGSPDNCGKICDEYAKKDKRIHVVHQENGGLSAARNSGIDWTFQHSDSEWITFIDSDDWVHPKYIEALYTAASDLCCNISVCAYKSVFNLTETVNVQTLSYRKKETEKCYCDNLGIVVSVAKLFHKSLWSNIRYPEGVIHEDEFTTYKVLFLVDQVAVIDSTLYYYYQRQGSIMKSAWSEKNLVIISAREQQLEYYKKRGLSKIHDKIAKVYILDLSDIISSKLILLPKELQKKHEKVLRKKLRLALIKYRSSYHYNWKSWTVLAAFPLYEKILVKLHLI